MKADYITFPNGQKFRVESNWNSFQTYCDLTGRKTLKALDKMTDLNIDDLPVMMWACMKEGERLDGHELKISIDDLRARLNHIIMGDFVGIYGQQTYAQLPEGHHAKKKFKEILEANKKKKENSTRKP